MNDYDIDNDKEILYEGKVGYNKNYINVTFRLTTKKMIFEKQKGLTTVELIDIIQLDKIKISNNSVQIKQKKNELQVETTDKNFSIYANGMLEAKMIGARLIDAVTGELNKKRGKIDWVDEALGLNTREKVKKYETAIGCVVSNRPEIKNLSLPAFVGLFMSMGIVISIATGAIIYYIVVPLFALVAFLCFMVCFSKIEYYNQLKKEFKGDYNVTTKELNEIIKRRIKDEKRLEKKWQEIMKKNNDIPIRQNEDSDVINALKALFNGCLIQFGVPVLLLLIFCYSFNNSSTDRDKNYDEYNGYCKLAGTYRNRYVQCYGDYSPSAKKAAEAKAAECNNPKTPDIPGCTGKFK